MLRRLQQLRTSGPPTPTQVGPLTKQCWPTICVYWSNQSKGWGRTSQRGCRHSGHAITGPALNSSELHRRTNALLTLDFDETVTQKGLGFRAIPRHRFARPQAPFPNGGFPPAPAYYIPMRISIQRQRSSIWREPRDHTRLRLVAPRNHLRVPRHRADYLLDEDMDRSRLLTQSLRPSTTSLRSSV